MKKLLSLLLLATVPAFAGTFHCTWNLIDFTTTPYNVRQIRIQSIAPYGVHSNAIITGDYFDRQVNSSGSVTVSNLVNGRSYRVTFFGPTVQTVFTNSFDTNVTGLVNGADYIAAPITDGNLVGWSRTQADARFLRTNITQYLRQGTNIVFVTNGNSLTIHGTATGGSGLGNPLTENLDFDGWLATNVFGLRPQVGETIEIVNAVIDGTFTGNGAGLTNLYASTNLEVVVSGRGIANGLSTRVNDGKQYGPDTGGTTTGGFQEAWNDSLASENLYGPRSAAVSIVIDGLVFFTNQLALSNQFTTAVSIRGNNPINDMLVYAGSNSGISAITIRGGAMPPAGSLLLTHDVRLRGFGVTAINDNTNVLLTITNYSHGEIIGMNFTSWMARTNQAWGAGTSIVGDGLLPRSSSLVGLVIGNGGENGTIIANNNFGHLGVGLHVADADHIYATDNTFSLIAFGESEFTNRWPASHPYSLGAAIMGTVGINWRFTDSYFYECTGECFLLMNIPGANPPIFIDRVYTEGGNRFLSAIYTNDQPVYITGPLPEDAYFARATNAGSIWTRVEPALHDTSPFDIKRFLYDNNRDNISDKWRLVYANKIEVSGDQYHGSAGGLSNFVVGINLSNVIATASGGGFNRFTIALPGLTHHNPGGSAFFETGNGEPANILYFRTYSAESENTNTWWWVDLTDEVTGVQGNFRGATNIGPQSLNATNAGAVGQVPKRISATQWYWADDDSSGGSGIATLNGTGTNATLYGTTVLPDGDPAGINTQLQVRTNASISLEEGAFMEFNQNTYITDQSHEETWNFNVNTDLGKDTQTIIRAGDMDTTQFTFVNAPNSFVSITNLNASVLTSGTVPDARLHGANPIFSGLTVTGATPGLILVTNPASASYVKIGTNDSIFGTNGGLAGMSYTLTNGGATFSSNVVAAKFFGDGSALTGISGGGGANYYSGDYYLGEFMENATPFGRYVFTANSGSILPVSTPLDTTHFGVVQISTSSSATAAPVLTTAQPGAFLPGSGYTLTNSWWLRLEDLSTGAENYQLRAGFSDSTTSAEPTDAVMFRYSSDTNSGNWQLVTRAVGAESVSNTVSAVSADTWYKLTVEVNSTSTLASFYVNDTLVGTLASNIPDVDSSVNRCFGSVLQMVKAVGTTARICYVDAVTYAVNGPARTP